MEEAEYCHRLALMNRGRLIALDTPSGVRGRLHAPLLEVAVSDATAAARALEGATEIRDVGIFGRSVHVVVDDPEAARSAIAARLEARGIALHRIEAVPPSLEDVFIALVRAEGGALAG
jgi:ABC-2 type transport system ATP-binding protein